MKEDPLEQAAKEYAEMHLDVSGNLGKYLVKAVFQDGAQWQAKRMYSEENVFQFFEKYREDFSIHRNIQVLDSQFKDWFNDIKKK